MAKMCKSCDHLFLVANRSYLSKGKDPIRIFEGQENFNVSEWEFSPDSESKYHCPKCDGEHFSIIENG